MNIYLYCLLSTFILSDLQLSSLNIIVKFVKIISKFQVGKVDMVEFCYHVEWYTLS